MPAGGGHKPGLGQLLHHHDRSQLWFQIAEIVGERTYLQHGIRVREGDVVLDVGANVGVAAAFFASTCQAGLVHSFEPVAPIFDLLRQNVQQFPACVAHRYGLSRIAGEAEITYYPAAAAMSGLYADPARDRELARACMINGGMAEADAAARTADRYDGIALGCELRTLSSVLRDERIDRVDLLKVDVEHAELDVLAGIGDEDWPRIRQVVVEAHGESARRGVAETLRDHGLAVTSAEDGVMAGTGVHMLYGTRR